MNNIYSIRLVIAFLLCTSFAQAQQNTTGWSKDSVIQKMERFYLLQGVMGMTFTISLDSAIVVSKGFGYTNVEKSQAANPEKTLFRIASLSKPITATCMGTLVDQGVLQFDESVYKYVPDFPKKKYDLTLRHLASNTSGIRHYKWLETENKKDLSIQQGLEKFSKSKLAFKPGTNYLYSSYGYNLLGFALQNASNQPFFELVKEKVLEPLEMNHTIADNGEYGTYQVTEFFKRKKKIKKEKDVNIFFKLPSGGFLSTSEDLVRLGNSYIYQTLLSEKTSKEILTRQTLTNGESRYGLGWGISTDKKGRTYNSHSGGGVGAVSRIVVYPNEKYCMTVLINTNCDYIALVNLVRNISEYILDNQ